MSKKKSLQNYEDDLFMHHIFTYLFIYLFTSFFSVRFDHRYCFIYSPEIQFVWQFEKKKNLLPHGLQFEYERAILFIT